MKNIINVMKRIRELQLINMRANTLPNSKGPVIFVDQLFCRAGCSNILT